MAEDRDQVFFFLRNNIGHFLIEDPFHMRGSEPASHALSLVEQKNHTTVELFVILRPSVLRRITRIHKEHRDSLLNQLDALRKQIEQIKIIEHQPA